jgi:hypothetical protein
MRTIGLMLCRNEIDILDQFMRRHLEFFDTIVAIDESTDGSREALLDYPQIKHVIKGEELPYPPPFRDGMRCAALQFIRETYGYDGWITLVHPDEWWVDDPNQAASDAEREGADCVLWHALEFFLHVSQKPLYQRPGWERIPVRERLDFFQPGFYEFRQFKNRPGVAYDPKRHAQTMPDYTDRASHLKAYSPVFSHYSTRSPEQARARARDRVQRDWNSAYLSLVDDAFCDRPMVDCPLLEKSQEQAAWLRTFPKFGHQSP